MDGAGVGRASSSRASPPKLFCLAVFRDRKERGGEGVRAPLLVVCVVLSMFGGFFVCSGG